MKFESRHNYQNISDLSSRDIRTVLGEIKLIINARLQRVLSEFKALNEVKNQDEVDNKNMNDSTKRIAYFNAVESIANDLNELGHNLLPIDQDNDIDFESCSISWGTAWMDDNPCGLDLEISPIEVQVLWVMSPNT
jgi:hypothetical protein